MAKKRKTLDQKKQADQRQLSPQIEQTMSTSPVYSLRDFTASSPTQSTKQPTHSNNSTTAIAYAHAFGDLRKTLFTTVAIVLAQIVLSFIVNK